MSHAYTKHNEEIVDSWRRIHANGEETHVHILSCGEDRFVTVAVDVDPRDFRAVAADAISYSPTKQAAHERAQAYLEANPRGIAAEEQSGMGMVQKIWAAMKKLDQSATPATNDNNDG